MQLNKFICYVVIGADSATFKVFHNAFLKKLKRKEISFAMMFIFSHCIQK